MTNTLKVIRPFMAVEENDVFEKTEDGLYDCSYSTDETIVNTSNMFLLIKMRLGKKSQLIF